MCVAPAEKPKKGGAQHKAGKGEYTEEFEHFWSLYPRRVEKAKAFRAWNTRLKEDASAEVIIEAATNYSLYCRNQKIEEKFIKHPSTFLGPDKPYEEYINWQPSVQGLKMPKNIENALNLIKKAEQEEHEGGSVFD